MNTEWDPLIDNRHTERFLSQPREQQWIELQQELNAEIGVLRERVEALQHELTQEQRRAQILEQRLRRIGDAVVEGRTVDGL